MADGRKLNGGAREGSGRKPKADEVKFIERITPLADVAFDSLKQGIDNGDTAMIKLWFEYFYGKPKQQMDITSDGKAIKLPSWIDDGKS